MTDKMSVDQATKVMRSAIVMLIAIAFVPQAAIPLQGNSDRFRRLMPLISYFNGV